MRYLLSRHIPEPGSILLVESGSRHLLEHVIPLLRETWGEEAVIDLVTCFPKPPAGLPPNARIYKVTDYHGSDARAGLYRELRRNRYSQLGIICSGEPLMTKWKWALTFRIPAKVFMINENGDYFWLDRAHIAILRELVLLRSGLAGAGAVRTLARVFSFPFTFLYLLLYATIVHTRRALRRG